MTRTRKLDQSGLRADRVAAPQKPVPWPSDRKSSAMAEVGRECPKEGQSEETPEQVRSTPDAVQPPSEITLKKIRGRHCPDTGL